MSERHAHRVGAYSPLWAAWVCECGWWSRFTSDQLAAAMGNAMPRPAP